MFYTVKIMRGKTVHLQKVYIGVDDTTLKNFAATALRDCGDKTLQMKRLAVCNSAEFTRAGAWSACPAPFPLRQNGLFRKQCIISLFRSTADEVGGPTQTRESICGRLALAS